jgi:hemerythrin-like domain-containing protein
VLYSALERFDETRWSALQHRREALKLERLIERVSALAYDDEAWSYAFAQLAHSVQQHVAEEEDELFPMAQRVVGLYTAQALRTRYELTKLPTSH